MGSKHDEYLQTSFTQGKRKMSKYQAIALSNCGRWRFLCVISANLSTETVLKLAVQCSRRKKKFDIGGRKNVLFIYKIIINKIF